MLACLLVVLRALLPLQATDDCTLGLEAVKPILSHRPGAVRGLRTVEKKPRRLVERAALRDGVVVTVTIGGCVHFAYNLQYENVRSRTPLTDRPAYLALARQWIDRTPSTDEGEVQLQTLRKALAAAAPADAAGPPGLFRLACGDAVCELLVEATGAGRVTLTVGYDFPL